MRLIVSLYIFLLMSFCPKLWAEDDTQRAAIAINPQLKFNLLQGPWEFYWQKLLAPGDPLPPKPFISFSHQNWNHLAVDPSSPNLLGYGTYRMVIKDLKQLPEGYSLGFKSLHSAHKLLLYPSQKPNKISSLQAGTISTEASFTVPAERWSVIRFYPEADETEWTLLIQTANFHTYGSGFSLYAPMLGVGESITNLFQTERATFVFSIGILLSVCAFSFMMFLRYPKDLTSLMQCLFSLVIAMRTVAMADFMSFWFGEDKLLIYLVQKKMEYIPLALGPLCYVWFLHWTFRPFSSVRPLQLISLVNLAITLLCLLTSPEIFQKYLPHYQAFILTEAIWILYVVGRALRHRAPGAHLVLTGALLCIGGSIWDILVSKLIIDAPFILQYCISAFMLIQSEVVAQRAALAFYQSRRLARELKYEMQARVMMVSDLAHRTNNPLNYIATGIRSLKDELYQQNLDIQDLFRNADSEDPEVKAIQTHFQQRFVSLTEALETMMKGIQRSAGSVAEIRTLSGVDGYAQSMVRWTKALEQAKSRLIENIGEQAKALSWELVGVEDLYVNSNETVLTLVLEHIFRFWIEQRKMTIKLNFLTEIRGKAVNVIMLHHTLGPVPNAQELESLENLGHIIKPYGCDIIFSDDLLQVSLTFQTPEEAQSLDLAS